MVRAWRRSGAPGRMPSNDQPPASSRVRSGGSSRASSTAAGPSTASSSSSGSAASAGPMARTSGPYGSSVPAGMAPPRRTVIGALSSAMRAVASSKKRLMPTPAGPLTSIALARPWAASSSTAASRPKASSRPTYRALTYRAGMTPF